MALIPNRTKYRKVHKGRIRGDAKRGDTIAFGEFAIQTMERGKITSQQIEAARIAINRHFNARYLYPREGKTLTNRASC